MIHALLELNCIPSGMELFPAANEDRWTLIQGAIVDLTLLWIDPKTLESINMSKLSDTKAQI